MQSERAGGHSPKTLPGGERLVLRPPVDTLIVEPEAGICELVLRAAFPVGRGGLILREVVVSHDD